MAQTLCSRLATISILTIMVFAASTEGITQFQSYTKLRPDTVFRMDYRASVETPNWARDTIAPVFRISAWNQCPNGTDYVLRQKASPVGQNSDFPRDFVIGCCPTNFTGCTLPGNDRVLGCCPQGQQCSYTGGSRAYVGNLRFLACIDEPSQDCNTVRCPAGYLCCPHKNLPQSICVPHDGDPDDYEAMCGQPVQYAPNLLSPMRKVRDYTFYEGGQRLRNATLVTVQGVANVTVDTVVVPPQFVCKTSKSRCRVGDICSLSDFVAYNVTRTLMSHCCPANHTVCHGFASERDGNVPPTLPGGFVGCADDVAGEQCCGDSICPPGHKCCSSIHPLSGLLVDKQCCPIELECCYGDPGRGAVGLPLVENFRHLARSYCGMSVFNNTCAMDRWAPSQNFVMNRASRGGIFPTLDP